MGHTDIGWSGTSQSLCPLPLQDKLLLDVGSFKVIILGNALGLGFNSLEEGKTARFLIYFIPTAFLLSMPGSGTSWVLCPHGSQDFIPGHSSGGLLLPRVLLPFSFSYLFTSTGECLPRAPDFPPKGIRAEPVGLQLW